MPDNPTETPAGTPPADAASAPATPPAPATETPSAPAAAPAMPPPSAMVEPFQSAGGPPPTDPTTPKKGGNGLTTVLVVLLLLGAGAGGYFAVNAGMLKLGGSKPAATPKPAPVSDSLDTSYQQLDSEIGQLTNDLTNIDTSLGDKQGDLSE